MINLIIISLGSYNVALLWVTPYKWICPTVPPGQWSLAAPRRTYNRCKSPSSRYLPVSKSSLTPARSRRIKESAVDNICFISSVAVLLAFVILSESSFHPLPLFVEGLT
jgi:hypothetical protein